jgi:hypothetical protein
VRNQPEKLTTKDREDTEGEGKVLMTQLLALYLGAPGCW